MSVVPSPARCRAIPPDTPHSIIICLPGWDDNVEVATGNQMLLEALETTYPRFFIHIFVKQVRRTTPPIILLLVVDVLFYLL